MIELYHNNMSVCSQKVRLALAEKRLQAREHHLNLRAGDQQRPAYTKLNPNAYVPTLVHDGAPIIESAVICEYLEETFPDPALLPTSAAGRAAARLWTRRADAGVFEACGTISNAIAFRFQWLARSADELARIMQTIPDRNRRARRQQLLEFGTDAPTFVSAVWTYDKLLSDMERALAGQAWLLGDAYSLADLSMTPYINRLAQLELSGMWSPSRPNVAAWLDRVRQRENYRAAITPYDDPKYLALMSEQGRGQWPKVEAILTRG